MKEKKYINCSISNVYEPLYNTDALNLYVYGGNGSGKSHTAADYMVTRLMQYPNLRDIACRNYYNSIYRSQFEMMLKVIRSYGLSDHFTVKSSTEREPMNLLCKHTNSKIYAIGAQDIEKIKSFADPSGIWIEEPTELNNEKMSIIKTQIKMEASEAPIVYLYTFNPISVRNWLYTSVFEPAKIEPEMGVPIEWTTDADIDGRKSSIKNFALRTCYQHNRANLSNDYLTELMQLKVRNPRLYRVAVLAEWGSAEESGFFPSEYWQNYDTIPSDAVGMVYVDQNLAMKNRGDTTAIVKGLYSGTTQRFYITDFRCKNYADSNELLIDCFSLLDPKNCYSICFDGNVSQESTWKQHVRNFETILSGKSIFPQIMYHRNNVNNIALYAQAYFNSGHILFNPNWDKMHGREGDEFKSQVFAFTGKKLQNKKDDAPDALINLIYGMIQKNWRPYDLNRDLYKKYENL